MLIHQGFPRPSLSLCLWFHHNTDKFILTTWSLLFSLLTLPLLGCSYQSPVLPVRGDQIPPYHRLTIKLTLLSSHHWAYIIKSTPLSLHHWVYTIEPTPLSLHHWAGRLLHKGFSFCSGDHSDSLFFTHSHLNITLQASFLVSICSVQMSFTLTDSHHRLSLPTVVWLIPLGSEVYSSTQVMAIQPKPANSSCKKIPEFLPGFGTNCYRQKDYPWNWSESKYNKTLFSQACGRIWPLKAGLPEVLPEHNAPWTFIHDDPSTSHDVITGLVTKHGPVYSLWS